MINEDKHAVYGCLKTIVALFIWLLGSTLAIAQSPDDELLSCARQKTMQLIDQGDYNDATTEAALLFCQYERAQSGIDYIENLRENAIALQKVNAETYICYSRWDWGQDPSKQEWQLVGSFRRNPDHYDRFTPGFDKLPVTDKGELYYRDTTPWNVAYETENVVVLTSVIDDIKGEYDAPYLSTETVTINKDSLAYTKTSVDHIAAAIAHESIYFGDGVINDSMTEQEIDAAIYLAIQPSYYFEQGHCYVHKNSEIDDQFSAFGYEQRVIRDSSNESESSP